MKKLEVKRIQKSRDLPIYLLQRLVDGGGVSSLLKNLTRTSGLVEVKPEPAGEILVGAFPIETLWPRERPEIPPNPSLANLLEVLKAKKLSLLSFQEILYTRRHFKVSSRGLYVAICRLGGSLFPFGRIIFSVQKDCQCTHLDFLDETEPIGNHCRYLFSIRKGSPYDL